MKITLEELASLQDELDNLASCDDVKVFGGKRDSVIDYSSCVVRKDAMEKIKNMIQNSEVVTNRNFDKIQVGTAFYGRFLKDDLGRIGELERFILVSSNRFSSNHEDFLSIDSPLGRAVYNRKDDEVILYDVALENGKKQSMVFYIDQIDRNLEHYMNNRRAK